MRLIHAAALVILAAEAVAPEQGLRGWASAYDPGVMQATVEYRREHGLWWHPLPRDWYTVAGYVATNDCTQIGRIMTLIDPGGREWRVLVADCGGDEPGAGSYWMTENNIIVEMDATLWRRLTAEHGRPLRVELRDD